MRNIQGTIEFTQIYNSELQITIIKLCVLRNKRFS